jgi:23S rRNA G2445 N2-methylase RlmL
MYSNVANGWLQHKVGKQQRERNLNSFEIAAIVKKGIVNQSKRMFGNTEKVKKLMPACEA